MTQTKPIVLSDIHLERVNPIKQKFLLSSINEKVEEVKKDGFEPIVICAGDINNSTKGYEFLSQINANVLYIAGNHEFWECDYFETLQKLKNEAPPNVTFLHNDTISCGEYLFLGATLWTDIGQSLNKDLLVHAGVRMNDMNYITAKEWYSDEKNVKRLLDIFPTYYVETLLKNKTWNALIELDENQKGWDFLNNADSVLKALKKVNDITSRLEQDLSSQYPWAKISKKAISDLHYKADYKKDGLKWRSFITGLHSIDNRYNISEEEKTNYLKNSEQKDSIFQKLRFMENISDKKITILSHHLPFYEEILVGSIMKDHLSLPVKLHNQTDSNLFLIRSGEDYPGSKYLTRAKKGEVERAKDITHIVNYYNNGTNKLGDFLLSNTSLWIHGHEHHFRFCDYVKGIMILTNPSGSSLSLIDTNSGTIKLNPHYIAYNGIKGDEESKAIATIKKGMTSEPGPFVSREQLRSSVQLWALKHFNWTDYTKVLRKVEKSARELLLLSIEYIQKEDSESEDDKLVMSSIEEKISLLKDTFNYNCQKIDAMHEALDLAFKVRTEKDFSFQSYLTKSLSSYVDIYSWTMGNANPPELVADDGVIGIFNAKKYFETKGNIKIALKYAEKLKGFLETTSFKHVYEVQPEDIAQFIELSQKALTKDRVAEKIAEKWTIFCSKTFEKDPSPRAFNSNSPEFF